MTFKTYKESKFLSMTRKKNIKKERNFTLSGELFKI